MQRRPPRPSRYQPHPLLDRERSLVAKVEKDTGRSWSDWIALARRSGLKDAKALRERLRGHLGLKPMAAAWIAHEALSPSEEGYGNPEVLVEALYAGDRQALRPVHEALVDEFLALGDDVVVTACKTMVPVYRKHVFAELRPAGDAVEVRLALGDVRPVGRLGKASRPPPGSRLTHAVRVRTSAEIDGELRTWLGLAYAQGAGAMVRKAARIPPDLAKAIAASRPASATWASMTPAMRREMIEWVVGAKQEATRARRVAASRSTLAAGRKRVY